jgi:glycerophosphoryl diester phosphodiesterase
MEASNTYRGTGGAAPRRFAHRGVAQAAPENTIGAFEAAASLGLEGIEIDVHITRDGVPVVIHDSNLTRLTCGHPSRHSNARVRDCTWEELSQIEIPYANHTLPAGLPPQSENEFLATCPERVLGLAGDYVSAYEKESRMARIPRLADFLDWLAAQPLGLEAEIEVCAGNLARPIFDLADGHPAAGRIIVFSGSCEHVREMQALAKTDGKPAGLRFGANIRELAPEWKERLAQMDMFEVGLNAGRFTLEDVAWLKDRGVQVLSNLGDAPAWWEKLCGLETYGFKTNYAQAYSEWWQGAHARRPA